MKQNHSLLYAACIVQVLVFCSCSAIKKDRNQDASGMLGDISSEESEEVSVDRLKALADSPNSMLPGALASGLSFGESESPEATPPPSESSLSPENWGSRSIYIGDIFSDNSGPLLKKAASIGDALSSEQRQKWLNGISKVKIRQIPMTLSPAELANLKEQAGPDLDLPTRSVALDFQTFERTTNRLALEKQLADITTGTPPSSLNTTEMIDKLSGQLDQARKRLEAGETLFIITGVTESEVVKASYPGAPVGTRDAQLVQNAFQTLYPHLDQLEAGKTGELITITRPPRVYWEFEARELKLDGDRLSIARQALAQN